ncbi:MAG: hypothetical protein GXZ12_05975 [Clostridiaceae bacterium]|nr:hypothetical protein [Clostridiaceae bacterium]
MKKKLLLILFLVVVLLFAKQSLNYFYNGYVLSKYRQDDFSMNEDLLLTFNCFEPYIVHYNNGNLLYMNSLYLEAVEEYKTSLTFSGIPEDRDCSIRINLALALLGSLGDDYEEPENIAHAIEVLNEARDVLLENGCASDDGEGHSKKAQELKEYIDELIDELEELQQQQQQQQTETSSSSDSSGSDTTPSSGSSDSSDSSGETTTESSGEPSDTSGSSGTPSDTGSSSNQTQQNGQNGSETTNFSQYESSIQEQIRSDASYAYDLRQDELESYRAYDEDWNYDYNGVW